MCTKSVFLKDTNILSVLLRHKQIVLAHYRTLLLIENIRLPKLGHLRAPEMGDVPLRCDDSKEAPKKNDSAIRWEKASI